MGKKRLHIADNMCGQAKPQSILKSGLGVGMGAQEESVTRQCLKSQPCCASDFNGAAHKISLGL